MIVTPEAVAACAVLGAVFILGSWYGLYLNLTHMYRMRRWAERVAMVMEAVKDAEVRGAQK